MLLALSLPSPHTLLEYGVVLVGVGSILSVIGLLEEKDKGRAFPLAVVLLAFGSVLTLAPEYAQSNHPTFLRVMAGIATITFAFGALDYLRRRIGWPKRFGYIDNDAEQKQQAPRPIGNNVSDRQHLLNIDPARQQPQRFTALFAFAAGALLARLLFRRDSS